MIRHDAIQNAYQSLGTEATFAVPVGKLPFGDNSFDLVLSLNGFHAFPDKEAAYREVYRVLRPDGVFCGCFYVKGGNRRTDWFVEKLYTPKGFFTPPYETSERLRQPLERQYRQATVETVESMACFICRKGGDKNESHPPAIADEERG